MAKGPKAYEIAPDRKVFAYLFTALFLGWVLTMMTINYIQAFERGYGTGIGDGHLQPSYRTPGGPYFPPDWTGPRTPGQAQSSGGAGRLH